MGATGAVQGTDILVNLRNEIRTHPNNNRNFIIGRRRSNFPTSWVGRVYARPHFTWEFHLRDSVANQVTRERVSVRVKNVRCDIRRNEAIREGIRMAVVWVDLILRIGRARFIIRNNFRDQMNPHVLVP